MRSFANRVIEDSKPFDVSSDVPTTYDQTDEECVAILEKAIIEYVTVPNEDISKLLLYYSNKTHPQCIATLLSCFKTFNNADTIQQALSLCLKNGSKSGAFALLRHHSRLLDKESIFSIIRFNDLKLLRFVLGQPTVKELIKNENPSEGLTFAECAILTNKYNMIAELANVGASFDRAVAICGSKSKTLKPPFFGRSVNDAKLQLLLPFDDEKAMENLVDAICNGVFNNESLTAMAEQLKFKERLFACITSFQPAYLKEILNNALTEGHPLNTIFMTPTGWGFNNPSASHGYILKIINKLKEVEKELEKTTYKEALSAPSKISLKGPEYCDDEKLSHIPSTENQCISVAPYSFYLPSAPSASAPLPDIMTVTATTSVPSIVRSPSLTMFSQKVTETATSDVIHTKNESSKMKTPVLM